MNRAERRRAERESMKQQQYAKSGHGCPINPKGRQEKKTITLTTKDCCDYDVQISKLMETGGGVIAFVFSGRVLLTGKPDSTFYIFKNKDLVLQECDNGDRVIFNRRDIGLKFDRIMADNNHMITFGDIPLEKEEEFNKEYDRLCQVIVNQGGGMQHGRQRLA